MIGLYCFMTVYVTPFKGNGYYKNYLVKGQHPLIRFHHFREEIMSRPADKRPVNLRLSFYDTITKAVFEKLVEFDKTYELLNTVEVPA